MEISATGCKYWGIISGRSGRSAGDTCNACKKTQLSLGLYIKARERVVRVFLGR